MNDIIKEKIQKRIQTLRNKKTKLWKEIQKDMSGLYTHEQTEEFNSYAHRIKELEWVLKQKA